MKAYPMPRKTFIREVQEIKDEILLLASMVEEAVIESVQALRENDMERSRRVWANDFSINRKRYEIEMSIIVLMAIQQPIARDLRLLAASLEICTELERIGDYAKAIANINLRSGGTGVPGMLRQVSAMAEKAVDVFHRAMTAYADQDMHKAASIIRDDDMIDECYARLYYDAVQSVVEESGNIERANYIIWVAHNLERLGDRTTNICKRVIYMVSGEHYQNTPVVENFVL